MTERIPDPIAGQDVLPWAGKVTRRLNALDDKAGAQSRNERLHETHLPQPFEVRWDGTLNDWAGGWKIYLPAGDLVVLPKGVTIDPTGDLSALGDGYPDGWYLVPAAALAVDASGTLYLNITLGDSPSAEFSSSASAADENEIAVEICATSVGTNPAKHEVVQFVTTAIVLGDEEVEVDDKSIDWRTDTESQNSSGSGSESGGESGSGSSEEEKKSLEIKGWKTQQASATSLVEALGLPLVGANNNNNNNSQSEGASGSGSGSESGSGSSSSESGSSREVVVRNGPDGALEYVPLGIVDLANILANINDGKLSITYTDPEMGVVTKKFTANQATNTSITIPAPGNGTITIKQGDTTLGYFTVNQAGNTTITVPAAPTVNDGTLTIKQGSSTLGTFTANQATNSEIVVPANKKLTVHGSPTTSDGTATETVEYNTTADKTVRLDGLVTKGTAQEITGAKVFTSSIKIRRGAYGGIYFQPDGADTTVSAVWSNTATGDIGVRAYGSNGSSYFDLVGSFANQCVKLTASPTADPNNGLSGATTQVPTLKWVDDYYLKKTAAPSGSVVVLRKVKYDTSTRKIMAAYSKINLATGAVTAPNASEIPADNDAKLLWAEVAEAVPHSSVA